MPSDCPPNQGHLSEPELGMNRQLKRLLKTHLPDRVVEAYMHRRAIRDWRKRDFLENAPQFVKEKVFLKYGISDTPWVETGTFTGTTTRFLSSRFPFVYSIEPETGLYGLAVAKFKQGRRDNVELFNGVSEDVLPELLPSLEGDINFWLDGHYSHGETYKGATDCPVEMELESIRQQLPRFSRVAILIDDVRCFLAGLEDFPSIDYLVDWARGHQFSWCIEHDIFIMRRH